VTTFAAASVDEAVAPMRRVTLPPSAFKPGKDAPREPVTFGIRILSEGDTLALRRDAHAAACKAFPDLKPGHQAWVAHYNQILMLNGCVEAVCDKDDRFRPWHEMQKSLLPRLLGPGGVERIWDELEELTIETAPTSPEASPEDLVRLSTYLARPEPFSHLSAADARGLRRLLKHAVTRLTPPE
jgi:hypothetical protein